MRVLYAQQQEHACFGKLQGSAIQKTAHITDAQCVSVELQEDAERRNRMEKKLKWIEDEEARVKEFLEATGGAITENMTYYLQKAGYFIAPAAKTHHGAYIGGLYAHSKQVAMELSEITIRMGLKWQRPQSPIIVGFLHDVCKTKEYSIIVDDEMEAGYRIEYNKERPFPGHGEASALMVQQYILQSGEIILTEEELMCIRYHMGAFTDKSEWEFYSRAVKKYPNVLWTQTADMIASQIKGV